MSLSLTATQRELLSFITCFIQAKGYSPSFDEMAAATGLTSRSSISGLVAGLEERGAIRRLRGRARAIEVLAAPLPVSRAPDGAPLYFVPVGK